MIGYFTRHPVAANLLMLLICILGISVVPRLERETFPAFTADSVAVSVVYPGASAPDVDEEICAPLEDALTGITGLADFECLSVDGRAAATAELEEGGELTQFFNDVFSAVSGVNDFPDDAESPAVEINARTDLVAMIAVSGVTGREGLIEYADTLADELIGLEGVAEASVLGITDREFRVSFDQTAMRRYGLSGKDIADAITARSLQQPLGSADLADGSMVMRYTGASRTAAELEDLIILQGTDGGIVRLADLATVDLVDSDENTQSTINGQTAAIISISKSSDQDSIRVFERIQQVIEAERALYPAPFDIAVINNLSDVVKDRINLILGNIAMGLALVFVTMWLFFSLREALWISATLPVSFLGGLFLMSALGITINMISLIALLMAVGLIMDDSIVIAENIDKWRRRTTPLDAAAKGAMEVMPGVLSSFLTTACVFGPLMFLSGEMGQILRFIPMVLLLTLSLSLVEGFLILPHHLSHVPHVDPQAHSRRPAVRLLERFTEGVLIPLAAWMQKLRYLTLGSVVAALILSVGLLASGQVKLIGFPSSESDSIVARVALTSGISRDRTVATVDHLVAGLEEVDAELTPGTEGGQPLVERVLVQYGVNSDVSDNGSNTATITVDLLESGARNVAADDVLLAWRKAAGPLPDIVQSSFSQSELGPGGLDIDVELLGQDLTTLEAAASDLVAALLERDDVTEAYSDFYGGREEVQLELNAYGYSVGLTPQSLSAQLRNAFEGTETDSFRQGVSDRSIRVELADSVASLTDLETFPVVLPVGSLTVLATVADLTLTSSYATITRMNGKAVARVQGKIDRSATTSTALSAIITGALAPQLMADHPGVEIRIGGATEDQQKSQSSIMSALMLGLVGVYLVLAFQFRSYGLPLVVMTAIPFALIGSILGHWALGMDMSMPSLIGFASLAGIVVNNAILFLTFFQNHLEGDDYETAALNAVRARFRPILLSTSTTFAGLLPIMFNNSPQVQTLVPLVVSVAFGLIAAMVLVVLVFPSVLSIYFDAVSVRRWIGKFDGRAAPEGA